MGKTAPKKRNLKLLHQYISPTKHSTFRFNKEVHGVSTSKTFRTIAEAKSYRAKQHEPGKIFCDQDESSIRVSLSSFLHSYDQLTYKYNIFEPDMLVMLQERLQRMEVLEGVPFDSRDEETLPLDWKYSFIDRSKAYTWSFKFVYNGKQTCHSFPSLDEALECRRRTFSFEIYKRKICDNLPIDVARGRYPLLQFFNAEIFAYRPTSKDGEFKEAFDFFRAKLALRVLQASGIRDRRAEITATHQALIDEVGALPKLSWSEDITQRHKTNRKDQKNLAAFDNAVIDLQTTESAFVAKRFMESAN